MYICVLLLFLSHAVSVMYNLHRT